jgi:hypothetical protein
MAEQVIFHEEAIPVSKERHADLSVKTGTDYSFAKHVNAAPVTAAEFPAAAADTGALADSATAEEAEAAVPWKDALL